MSDDQKDTGSDEESTSELEPSAPGDIGDDRLPPDLQPTEDNPLARHPDQTGDEEDTIGADREEEPQTAPLHEDEADYGSGEGSGAEKTGGDGPGDGRVDAAEDDGSDTLDNGGGGAG